MIGRGFTLIEMLVTLALLGILASIVVPFAQIQNQHGKEMELRLALREIRTAIDAYKAAAVTGRIRISPTESGYPPDLQTLVNGAVDAQSASGARIFFLRRIPRDPMRTEVQGSSDQDWGLRSYASPPNAPAPGRDVYDVYSLSEARAADGTPYRSW